MLYLADYSDKAIVVYGNTFPYKQTIKVLKGRFNKHLSVIPGKPGGWIFSRKNQKHLEDFIKSVGGKVYLRKKSTIHDCLGTKIRTYFFDSFL